MPLIIKNHSLRQEGLTYFILLIVSSCLSYFLFMQNPWWQSDIDSDSYVWFLDFSRSIFQPQSAYYAESILLPLLAKILGATKTLVTYKVLCIFFTISILPISAIYAQRYFENVYQTLLFIGLFAVSFQYLQYYILGFPDPLTILLLVSAIFQKRLGVMFALLVFAMLSHFSMAALSVIALAGLVYCSPNAGFYSRNKLVGVAIASILTGKAILLVWYSLFNYKLLSRLDWALGKGYPFFLERYEANVMGFWLTPGALFLILYFLMAAYFLLKKRITFVLSALFTLAISYAALFLTIDGLRVFSVIIAAPYAYLLATFIQTIKVPKMKSSLTNGT